MESRVVAEILGMAMFVLYVGYMAVATKAWPLIIITVAVVAMAVYDFVVETRMGRG